MANYVDGFVLPVPKEQVDAYRRMARKAGKVWREHGALEYVECVADDVKPGKLTSFPQSVKLKPGEVVVFSWIVYKSRGHRDRVIKQGDDGPAPRGDDEPEGDAVRRQADVLRRLQGDGPRVTRRPAARPRRAVRAHRRARFSPRSRSDRSRGSCAPSASRSSDRSSRRRRRAAAPVRTQARHRD